MRRMMLALTVAVLMAGGLLSAQAQTSTTQMVLVNSAVFTTRLQYLMSQVAVEVLAEAHNGASASPIHYDTNCHSLRANYAKAVIGAPAQQASVAAVLVAGANFQGGVIVGTVTGSGATADSTANDTAVTTALKNLWNALSGCDTGT